MTIEKVMSEDGALHRGWNIVLSPDEMLDLHTGLCMSTATTAVCNLAEEIGDALEDNRGGKMSKPDQHPSVR